jgi:hypothetical protein
MNDYALIKSILAGTYSASVGLTEETAMQVFHDSLHLNPELRKKIREEINLAFVDHELSWRFLLAEYDVLYVEDELRAKNYAKRILLDIVAKMHE